MDVFREASEKLLKSFWETLGSFWEASEKLLKSFWEASEKFRGSF